MIQVAEESSTHDEAIDSLEQLKRLENISRVILVDLADALQNTPPEVAESINEELSAKNMFPAIPGEEPTTQIEELQLNLRYFIDWTEVISANDKSPKQSNLIVCNEIGIEHGDTYYFINGEIILARKINPNNQYENIIVRRIEIADCVTYILIINRNPELGEPSITLELTKKTTSPGFESASFKTESISSKIVQ